MVRSARNASVLQHVMVKRENLDAAWTHSEKQIPCCSEVLFWAKIHLEQLRRMSWSSRHARADHRCLRSIHKAVCRVESLSLCVACERWTADQIFREGEGTFSLPVQREHWDKGFVQALQWEGQTDSGMVSSKRGRSASPDASIAVEIKDVAFVSDPSWEFACCPRRLAATAGGTYRTVRWEVAPKRTVMVEVRHDVGLCGGPAYIREAILFRAVGPWQERRLPPRFRALGFMPMLAGHHHFTIAESHAVQIPEVLAAADVTSNLVAGGPN